METVFRTHQGLRTAFHFERPRLKRLFMEAVRFPLVMVCAGAGYGKTSAVHDFVEEYQVDTAWIQLSERDNVGGRFWENYVHTMAQVNPAFTNEVSKLGFPDTSDKLNQFHSIAQRFASMEKRIFVLDDFHFIEDPSVIRFVERILLNLPIATSVFMISRSTPRINSIGLASKGQIINISESDLRFTDHELVEYFRQMEIYPKPDSLREIMQDTDGWAFAINLIARAYQKAPGYGGYIRNAMKMNVFKLMETEIWNWISGRLQFFLVRLSLIGHLSVDLIVLLAGEDEGLIAEMERQNAYVRMDSYINAYLIHPLFLEFLSTKQELLSEEEKRETYAIAGNWCNKNGFKIDALSYYEKMGDYPSIVSILFALPAQIPQDIAKYAAVILDRAPVEAFNTVEFLAVLHMRSYMCQGFWKKSIDLGEYYEGLFLALPDENPIKTRTLSRLYYSRSFLRSLMCTMDDCYDFIFYVEKFCECLTKLTDPGIFPTYSPGPWINRAGSPREGAPEEYITELTRRSVLLSHYLCGFKTGEDELARAELKFFQGDTQAAESLIALALIPARDYKEFGITHLALLYSLRLSIVKGNYTKAEQALKEMKTQLNVVQYSDRYINYDIALAWYYCILGQPDKIPDWLKQDFSPYGHAGFTENFGNQVKARYCYLTRNFPPLLSYIREMKQRESVLFGRVEMLAIEACVHYLTKDKRKAFAALSKAYEAASPNKILMPFIELGKDMRTLTASALKESSGPEGTLCIPKAWLENINRKAASYAKRQTQVISAYKQANRMEDSIVLSPRETDILRDLSHGLSRAEIANNRNLSINTIKMVINNIYAKTGAENTADLIRIAAERRMI